MKRLLLPLTLLIAVVSPVSAQTAPQNGYETLVAAGKLLVGGENGFPSAAEILAPAENLRRQRLAVARNAPALQMVRQDVALPVSKPTPRAELDFTNNGHFRELARQFIQESAVRVADGDFKGALDSRLDCLEMGVDISGGDFIDMMVGGAVESIGRLQIEPLLPHLDALTCRAAAARLARIEAKRPAFDGIIRGEAEDRYQSILRALTDPESRRFLKTPAGRAKLGGDEGDGPTEAQARQFLALTPEKARQNIDRFYGAAIINAALPYQAAKPFTPPGDVDFQTAYATEIVGKPGIRFIYERNSLQIRLLGAALKLRANKLETGAYPAQFDAEIDPFSLPLQTLIYRSDGKTYQLYSVGPDGKDDGGAPMQSIVVNEQNRIKSLSNRVSPDALGDILATVF